MIAQSCTNETHHLEEGDKRYELIPPPKMAAMNFAVKTWLKTEQLYCLYFGFHGFAQATTYNE